MSELRYERVDSVRENGQYRLAQNLANLEPPAERPPFSLDPRQHIQGVMPPLDVDLTETIKSFFPSLQKVGFTVVSGERPGVFDRVIDKDRRAWSGETATLTDDTEDFYIHWLNTLKERIQMKDIHIRDVDRPIISGGQIINRPTAYTGRLLIHTRGTQLPGSEGLSPYWRGQVTLQGENKSPFITKLTEELSTNLNSRDIPIWKVIGS